MLLIKPQQASDLPLKEVATASLRALRPPLWMVTACRVVKALVELYGFTQFPPEDEPVSAYASTSALPAHARRAAQPPPHTRAPGVHKPLCCMSVYASTRKSAGVSGASGATRRALAIAPARAPLECVRFS